MLLMMEEALTLSDTIVVMNNGKIQQIGTPVDIYNEPNNAFVAYFIGESNIISSTMVRDKVVRIDGVEFECVDKGFGQEMQVDVVVRPEDVILVSPDKSNLKGIVTLITFKVSITRYGLKDLHLSGRFIQLCLRTLEMS